MLFSAPLHHVAGTETERLTALKTLNHRYLPQLEYLRQALLQARYDPRAPMPSRYVCLGCQVAKGADRRAILAFAACAPYAQAAESLVGHQLMLYAYHDQAYEKDADPGPGGVVGIRKLHGSVRTTLDNTNATALKMWQWKSEETNYAYRAEADATKVLWSLATKKCHYGLNYISKLRMAPREPLAFPATVVNDLFTLLGVPALQQQVAQHYGLQLSLNDPQHIIGTRHMHWRFVT